MRVVKAAAVQLSPVLYSREGTVEKVVRKIHKLGRQGTVARSRRQGPTTRTSDSPLQNIADLSSEALDNYAALAEHFSRKQVA